MINVLQKVRRFTLLFCFLAGIAVNAFAQASSDFTVSGTVTSQEEEIPLVGVTIAVKGTTVGTIADIDGKYSIQVPSENSILVFTFIGYQTQEITVGSQRTIDVALNSSVEQLDEVVVIGYGERQKRDLTGSITTVGSKDIEKTPFASAEFALQGTTTGVRVVNASGDPSDSPQIFVRGIGTFNGASQPLYVIDGQIISPPTASNQDLIGDINLWTLINPNDVESISVLKDASAAAIYGSRGANGVILITTKKGKSDRPRVEVNVQTGIQNIPTFDVLNRDQFIALGREMFTNSTNPDITLEDDLYGRNESDEAALLNNFSPQYDPQSPYYLGNSSETFDWQDAMMNQDALTQNYSVKVSGATNAANYYVSLGYVNQESVIKGDDLERYSLAVNVSTDIGKYITTGFTYRGAYQLSFNNSNVDLVGAAQVPPWQPIFDPNGPFGYALQSNNFFGGNDWNPARLYGRGTRTNFLAEQTLNESRFELIRNNGTGFVEIKPLPGLKIRGGLSLDYVYQQRRNFEDIESYVFQINGEDPFAEGDGGGSSKGTLGFRTNKFINYQADLTVNYNKTFGQHSVDLLFAVQDQFYKRFNEDVSTDALSTNDLDRIFVPNNRPRVAGFSGRDQKFWFGYVGRVSYNYAYKYYLDLSYRRDASAGFPKENRWGNFYSVSGAWRISSENFMKGVEFIDDLKIRGGWGQAGNDEAVAGGFAYLSGVNEQGSYGLGSGNGDATGGYNVTVALNDLPNRDITWETVETSYIGFDALMFNNTINATVEVYNRETNDILQFVDLPPSVGVNSPAFNIGKVRNRGVDLQLGYNGRVGEFTYNVSGNISFLQNEVLELYNDQPLFTGNFGRVEEGRPIGHIWGYVLGGTFQTQAEIDAYFENTPDDQVDDVSFVGPGDYYFLNVQGNPTDDEPFYSTTPDTLINNFDQTEIGQTIPGYTYGLNLSAAYKGFDVSINFYGEGDVDKVNSARQTLENISGAGTNRSTEVLNRWTPQNTGASLPRAIAGDPAGNNRFSSRWVENAAFFRLNTWQLGYSLPQGLLDKTNVFSRLRVYIGGQNNILITDWSGLDPVNDFYPLPKSYFVGLNVNF